MNSTHTKVLLALGTSIGDKEKNIQECIEYLKSINVQNIETASLYETLPEGGVAKNVFLNTAVLGEVEYEPKELLFLCKSIEFAMGRRKTMRWSDRIIDIDILLYGDQIIDYPLLKVPHPLFHLRSFALKPAVEIAGSLMHSVLKKTLKQL